MLHSHASTQLRRFMQPAAYPVGHRAPRNSLDPATTAMADAIGTLDGGQKTALNDLGVAFKDLGQFWGGNFMNDAWKVTP